MRRGFHEKLVALTMIAALGGCVQATRHSNVMLFGTNTNLGLKVGTDTAQVPSITVGYSRQEAVILPLVANTRSVTLTKTVTDTQAKTSTKTERQENVLEPCNIETSVQVVAQKDAAGNVGPVVGAFAPHPCLLVATDGKGVAKDSYSVLASFGAKFGADGNSTAAHAQGGLAQYFATGMAAQLLALNGGAAVVATGLAAETSTGQPKMTIAGETVTDDQIMASITKAKNYDIAIGQLAAKVSGTTFDKVKPNLDNFEKAIGSKFDVSSKCGKTSAECAKYLVDEKIYFGNYRRDGVPKLFTDALSAYPTVP